MQRHLIDTDQIMTAGHCFDSDEEALGASVTFDYQTGCDGNRLPAYSPRFIKVTAVLDHRYDSRDPRAGDWGRLRLASAAPGISPIQLRTDLPTVGANPEKVLVAHHPNGAVKKLSTPGPSFGVVQGADDTSITVPTTFHVSGGSSGSGLFDTAGRHLGILSAGNPCNGRPLSWFPSKSILAGIAPAPPEPITRDVMIVLDRSGSMSELDSTGRTKMEVARDAVSLFVQLIRTHVGNRVGLVSFSSRASDPPDLRLSCFEESTKRDLIGDAPYAGGLVGLISPNGQTSIGDGLDKARRELPQGPQPPGSNPRAILLVTDGMENTKAYINEIELPGIDVHAIGFGTAANLGGQKLSDLTSRHRGLFTRAETGVALQKFLHAFGNIFETGVLHDPEFDLHSTSDSAQPLTFSVCNEDMVTVAVGWDDINGALRVNLTSPKGRVISGSSPDVQESSGLSWSFLRVPFPNEGEQAGRWNVTVYRASGRSSFLPRFLEPLKRAVSSPPKLHYFVNVIPTGGPTLVTVPDKARYYTGDTINPRVLFTLAAEGGQSMPSCKWTCRLRILAWELSSPDLVCMRTGLSVATLHQLGRQPLAISDWPFN